MMQQNASASQSSFREMAMQSNDAAKKTNSSISNRPTSKPAKVDSDSEIEIVKTIKPKVRLPNSDWSLL